MSTATLLPVNNWVGLELCISADAMDLPPGVTLPAELWLESALVNRRGVCLGQRWYLRNPEYPTPTGTLDFISAHDIDGSHDVCIAFLARHGYRARGVGCPEALEYVRAG